MLCKEYGDRRMSENPKKKRRTVFIVAAVLTMPTFGVGLWVGKASVDAAPKQTPPVGDELEEHPTNDSVRRELAACQRKLARRMKVKAVSSAMDARSDESADAGAPTQEVQVLEREIKSCRRNERLHGAEICRSVRLYLDALMGLPKNDVLCVQRVRVSDYIEDDFAKCAAFKNVPADLDLDGYSDEERKTILDAVEVAKTLDEEKLTKHLNEIHRSCYGTWGKSSP
jgi:hypothetical protein